MQIEPRNCYLVPSHDPTTPTAAVAAAIRAIKEEEKWQYNNVNDEIRIV